MFLNTNYNTTSDFCQCSLFADLQRVNFRSMFPLNNIFIDKCLKKCYNKQKFIIGVLFT